MDIYKKGMITIKASTKRKRTMQAKRAFNDWFKVGAKATSQDGTKSFTVTSGEVFRMNPLHHQQYVSNKGHIVSFASGKPMLVKLVKDKRYYKVNKTSAHRTVAFAFWEEIEKFGSVTKSSSEIHHIKQGIGGRGKEYRQNSLENLEALTGDVHKILSIMQKTHDTRTEQQEQEINEKLLEVINEQSPNGVTIVIDGGKDRTSIHEVKQIGFRINKEKNCIEIDYKTKCEKATREISVLEFFTILGYLEYINQYDKTTKLNLKAGKRVAKEIELEEIKAKQHYGS